MSVETSMKAAVKTAVAPEVMMPEFAISVMTSVKTQLSPEAMMTETAMSAEAVVPETAMSAEAAMPEAAVKSAMSAEAAAMEMLGGYGVSPNDDGCRCNHADDGFHASLRSNFADENPGGTAAAFRPSLHLSSWHSH